MMVALKGITVTAHMMATLGGSVVAAPMMAVLSGSTVTAPKMAVLGGSAVVLPIDCSPEKLCTGGAYDYRLWATVQWRHP